MVSLYRNRFINLPREIFNSLLHGEIFDRYEVYLIWTIENYMFESPQVRCDFLCTAISFLRTLSNKFSADKTTFVNMCT